MEEILKLDNIHAGYGRREVLKGINLSVYRGEKLLVIGPNGSGKSTLLKVIVGEVKNSKGAISFRNEKLDGIPTYRRIRKGIGYLSQTNNIFPSLTVEDNFRLAFWDEKEDEFEEYENKLFQLFPFLKNFWKARAGILSGGQRQALAVGMVFLKEKDLYILDEPTAGLAPLAAKDILDVIKREGSEKEKTFILVEHNLRWVQDWYDRLIVMREGVIHSEKLSSEELSKDFLEKVYFEDESLGSY